MDADADGERVRACGGLETLDEGGVGRGQAERERFRRRRGDVVGCFGQEERLDTVEEKRLCEGGDLSTAREKGRV